MEESNKVSTVLQCFVDTNLELNENFPYAEADIPNIFFTQRTRTSPENTSVRIDVSLSSPSEQGRESVTVVFIPGTAGLEDIITDLPKTLTWSEGEQVKPIFIELKKDFELETGRNESFDLALVGAINCMPDEVNSITTTYIVDATEFNTVSFLETEESSVLPNGISQYLSYSYDTDSPVTLRLGLSNPSEAGVEKLQVNLYRLSTPNFDGEFSGLIKSIPIQFEIGEQTKDVIIDNIASSVLNSSPVIVATIAGTIKVSLDRSVGVFNNALLYVESNSLSISRRWTTINFGDFYRQKGPASNSYTELRSPVSSEIPQDLNESQNSWLIKYGSVYVENVSNETNGFAEANYEKFPIYKFGPSLNDSLDDISLLITNTGEFDIIWEDSIVSPGATFEVPINEPELEITLPSNSQLIEAGEIIPQTGENAIGRLYAKSLYSIKVKYNNEGYYDPDGNITYPHGFTLKSGNNNQISLGDFELTNYGNVFESQTYRDYLTGYYTSVVTRYNGSTCSSEFNEEQNVYDIRILGVILLDDTELTTSYGGFEFIKLDEFNATCGIANNSYSSPLWNGVEFEIAAPIDSNAGGD